MSDDGFTVDGSDPRNIRTREMLAAFDRMIPSPIEGVSAVGIGVVIFPDACWCTAPCGREPCPTREHYLEVEDSEL